MTSAGETGVPGRLRGRGLHGASGPICSQWQLRGVGEGPGQFCPGVLGSGRRSGLGAWGAAAGLAWGPGRGMGQGVLEERFSQGSGRPNPKGLLEGLAAPRPRAGTQCLHPAERPGWKFMVMGEDLSPRIG